MSSTRALSALASLAALGLAACLTPHLQRVPGPLFRPGPVSPPVDPGTPTVTVQRDSDPVWVRPPGERGDRPLQFYDKRARLSPGTLVRTGEGGRAELLWSPDASTLVMFDEGRVTLGDPEKGEPLARLVEVTRALLVLTPEDRIELPGGALLTGDALEPAGPIQVERMPGSIVRVTNESSKKTKIAYREAREELGPGDSIDLPVLVASGAAPLEAPEPQRFVFLTRPVEVYGRAERNDEDAAVRLTALEPARVRGFGIEAALEAQEWLRFSGLAQVAPVTPADPRHDP